MRPNTPIEFETLLTKARAGSGTSIGRLCESYRDYLRGNGFNRIPKSLQGKGDRSDLIQQTFLLAYSEFPSFRGTTEREWLAWLSRIFERSQLNFIRSYHAVQRRRQSLERPLPLAGASGGSVQLRGPVPTPSTIASCNEQREHLCRALERLPRDYRVAIELRQKEQLTFVEIGHRMNRSTEAARKLWTRGINLLSAELDL